MQRRLRDERGLAASTTVAVVFPVVLLLLWTVMTFALYFYGRSAAINVAATGAQAAAVHGGSAGSCQAAARALLDRVGDAISGVRVSCTRTGSTATATVTGYTLSLVPGWSPQVTQSASLPVERLTR